MSADCNLARCLPHHTSTPTTPDTAAKMTGYKQLPPIVMENQLQSPTQLGAEWGKGRKPKCPKLWSNKCHWRMRHDMILHRLQHTHGLDSVLRSFITCFIIIFLMAILFFSCFWLSLSDRTNVEKLCGNLEASLRYFRPPKRPKSHLILTPVTLIRSILAWCWQTSMETAYPAYFTSLIATADGCKYILYLLYVH